MTEPEEIREEIKQTREELGDTVTAVSEKTDVKQRAQDKATEAKEQISAKVEENPLPALAGVFLAGFVLGRLLSR